MVPKLTQKNIYLFYCFYYRYTEKIIPCKIYLIYLDSFKVRNAHNYLTLLLCNLLI